jgi:hypothetical protein
LLPVRLCCQPKRSSLQQTPSPSNNPLPLGYRARNTQPPRRPLGHANSRDVPEDPEQEDDERRCALEFGLPEPTYAGPIGQPRAAETTAPPPPAPSPPPPPSPGQNPSRPNCDTERVRCSNSDAWIDCGAAVAGIVVTFFGT